MKRREDRESSEARDAGDSGRSSASGGSMVAGISRRSRETSSSRDSRETRISSNLEILVILERLEPLELLAPRPTPPGRWSGWGMCARLLQGSRQKVLTTRMKVVIQNSIREVKVLEHENCKFQECIPKKKLKLQILGLC